MSTINLPNGPKKRLPLQLMKLIFQPIKYVEDFSKNYGDNFTLWGGKTSRIVYFSHPQAVQQIFNADSSYLDGGRGNGILKFLLGENSIVLLGGDSHKRQRQLLAPPFHGDRMKTYAVAIREIARQVSHSWKIGQPFNIRASMQEITLSAILRVVFGLDEEPRLDKLRYLLSSLLESISSPFVSAILFFPSLQKDLGSWSPWGRFLRLQQQIDEMIYALIQERRAECNQNRQDILSLMMSARDENGEAMTDEELHDELMTLLVAGHETTATALTWAFYWIDFVPEVRENLLAELNLLGDDPDPSTIVKLPYLTAVCQETLRIYPPAMVAFPRVVRSPMEVMGYNLPKGTSVIVSVYLAHHREEVYPQPKLFKPERFLERQFSPYEYLPFGGGNRRCIGMAFAQYEMKIVLATILSQFQVSRVNKRPVRPVRRGLTIAAPAGIQTIATPTLKPAKSPLLV
ncbi:MULTISPECIES: cytochrome P450 [Nostocales]|uniref:Cytochrome P450 n=3 Tax=Nostocales TaxID=1161 RepID=A0A0C1QUU9_9CYAN|nr:cytochrome P450 [Tolypothrix bouteillei]KAF3884963.1 cytochrome P450 [Tolypothrix bouteillei VB521301]